MALTQQVWSVLSAQLPYLCSLLAALDLNDRCCHANLTLGCSHRVQERGRETRPRYTVIDKVQCVQSPDDPSSEGALPHPAT